MTGHVRNLGPPTQTHSDADSFGVGFHKLDGRARFWEREGEVRPNRWLGSSFTLP